ncbi:MAG: hypothetical protein ACP5GX_07130 [Anaerolineae bacterium]
MFYTIVTLVGLSVQGQDTLIQGVGNLLTTLWMLLVGVGHRL